MKRIVFLALIAAFLRITAGAVSIEGLAGEKLAAFELPTVTAQGLLESFSVKDTALSLASGQFSWDFASLARRLGGFLFSQARLTVRVMVQIFVLCLLASVLHSLNFTGKDARAASLAAMMLVISVALTGANALLRPTIAAIDGAATFLETILPASMAAVALSGGTVSALTLHPTILFTSHLFVVIIKDFLLPLCFISLALGLASNICDSLSLKKLGELVKRVVKWALGLITTVFTGVVFLQKMVTVPADNAAIKSAKFVVGNGVPVVGGVLSDGINLVIGCGDVIKSALGAAGIIGLLIIASVPVVRLFMQSAAFGICSAVASPVCDKRVCSVLDEISKFFSLIAAQTVTLFFFFIIVLSIIAKGG